MERVGHAAATPRLTMMTESRKHVQMMRARESSESSIPSPWQRVYLPQQQSSRAAFHRSRCSSGFFRAWSGWLLNWPEPTYDLRLLQGRGCDAHGGATLVSCLGRAPATNNYSKLQVVRLPWPPVGSSLETSWCCGHFNAAWVVCGAGESSRS